MDSQVLESRQFHFSDVVVTADGIRELAHILEKETADMKSESFYYSFQIDALDGTTYESKTSEMLSNGGILEIKQVGRVKMRFRDFKKDTDIGISVTDTGHDSYGNSFKVGAADSTWVNGVMRLFEEAVNGWEKQPTWPRRYVPLLLLLFSLCIGSVVKLLLLGALRLLHITVNGAPDRGSALGFAVELAFAFMLGLPLALELVKKLTGLWPTVEIRTGREFARKSSQRRLRVWLIFAVAVFPFLINVLANLVWRLVSW